MVEGRDPGRKVPVQSWIRFGKRIAADAETTEADVNAIYNHLNALAMAAAPNDRELANATEEGALEFLNAALNTLDAKKPSKES